MQEIESTANRIATDYFSDLIFNKNEQVVTIWGAGASISSGIPSGYYIMLRMAKDLETIKNSSYFKTKLGAQSYKVRQDLELKTNLTFEYLLWIYSQVYGLEKLHEWLKQFIPVINERNDLPYFPSFSHEYFSHLVKGSYFKYIISTNFDEILENTLENELGYGNFKIIASKSEFERLVNIDIRNWESDFRAPHTQCFVFKPHGTISRRLTLRHTQDNVTHFEDEKRDVLKKIFNGSVIVFIGFGNYNENFWLLFGETYSMGQTKDILIIDQNVKQVIRNFPEARPGIRVYKYNGSIDDFFKEIFRKQEILKKVTKHLPTRHYIRGLFFDLFSRKLAKLEDEPAYADTIIYLRQLNNGWWFDLRIYELELLIYLFKSRGLFIQLAASECPRIITSYIKCLKWKNEFNKSGLCNELTSIDLEPTAILKSILNNNDDSLVGIGDVVDRFGKKALNIYWCFLLLSRKHHLTFQENRKISKNISVALESVFDIYCNEIAMRYSNHLYNKMKEVDETAALKIFGPDILKSFTDAFKTQISKLYYDFDIDIVEKDISARMRFICPVPITSRNELVKETNKLLQKNGDTLRISTISAEWFTKKLEEFKKDNQIFEVPKITILSNLSMFKNYQHNGEVIKTVNLFHFQQMIYNISKLIRIIRKWKINTTIQWYAIQNLQHHMTIFSKRNRNIMGIYFRREGKNAEVSPVSLTNEIDLGNLSDYFDDRINCLNGTGTSSLHGGLLFTVLKKGKNVEIVLEKNNALDRYEYKALRKLMESLFINDSDIKVKEKKNF